MRNLILLLLAAIVVAGCSPKTEYTHTYKEIIVDTVAQQQFMLDVLAASNNRNYTDKTKKRYDIDQAYLKSTWVCMTEVEGLEINHYSTGEHSYSDGYHIFIPSNALTEEQQYYFDMSKNAGSVTITVKHKKIKIK